MSVFFIHLIHLDLEIVFQQFDSRSRPSYSKCAGSSGAVHSVFLIDVYLDLKSPGGPGFWVGENRRVTEGNREGQFASIRGQRWTDPDTEGGFQVSRQGE